MYDFHKTRQENHENAFKNVMFKRGSKYFSPHAGTFSRTSSARIIRKIKKTPRKLLPAKKMSLISLRKSPKINVPAIQSVTAPSSPPANSQN
jgi:hypothetical protein